MRRINGKSGMEVSRRAFSFPSYTLFIMIYLYITYFTVSMCYFHNNKEGRKGRKDRSEGEWEGERRKKGKELNPLK